MNLLLVRSHQAEIIIVKRLIQERSNVTWMRVEPRSCDQSRRKNDAFTQLATLPNKKISLITTVLVSFVIFIFILQKRFLVNFLRQAAVLPSRQVSLKP